MHYYKLTDSNGQSFNNTQWGRGVTHIATASGRRFCSPALIHLYSSPELAVLLNPIHANFKTPRLWEAKARVVASDKGLKLGAKMVTTVKEIAAPKITIEMCVRFAIGCAEKVYTNQVWTAWATAWLLNQDRTATAADAAGAIAAYASAADNAAVYAAARAASPYAADNAAVYAAAAAAYAADTAARDTYVAARDTAYATVRDTYVAARDTAYTYAARAAARDAANAAITYASAAYAAARAATRADNAADAAATAAVYAASATRLDLVQIAREAVYGL